MAKRKSRKTAKKANGRVVKQPKKKIGRPKIDVDESDVEGLARIGCTNEEIATFVKCSRPTLERRFNHLLKGGREHFKMSLRRMQWTSASKGSVAMQIWLGKQYLGQSEKQVIVDATPKLDWDSVLQIEKGNGKVVDAKAEEVEE